MGSTCVGSDADEIVEQHLAASGGRPALGTLTSRVASGSISLITPAGEIGGTIETYAKAPNEARMLISVDLSAPGRARRARSCVRPSDPVPVTRAQVRTRTSR